MDKEKYREEKQRGKEIHKELKNLETNSNYRSKLTEEKIKKIEERLTALEKEVNPDYVK